MKYADYEIEKVQKIADIRDFIPDLKGSGSKRYCTCPECGATGKNKGLIVTHKTNLDIAKCFSCGFSIAGAIAAVEKYDNKTFVEALITVAQRYSIILESEEEKRARAVKRQKLEKRKSFCEAQLDASGLTFEDVTAKVLDPEDKSLTIYQPTFVRGGIDRAGNVNNHDDEMLILYYDLWGNRVKYATKGLAGKLKDYVRVRWSNPALHVDNSGREIKYQTPKGAQAKFYIPQYIRSQFAKAEHIETLIIQEGEKKAEKACKHGIASIGIQGIYNIGNEETGLIQDLQYLVQKCTIKNIVLLMDSDWNYLHQNIAIGDHVDQRPNQFAKAVIKFRTYIETMHNLGVSVDVFFGHINENENHEKGIDDLLVGTLKDHEDELLDDMVKTIFSHDGIGRFADIHKLSSKTDFQIKDFWCLNDRDAFFEQHKERLKGISHFRISRISYRVESGSLIQNSKIRTGDDFWLVSYEEKTGKKKVSFEYIEAFRFISSNGYYRIHTEDCDIDQYKFVRIDDGVVNLTGPSEIRDFVYNYALQTVKDRDVIMMLAAKLGSLLGVDKLERIEKICNDFDNFEPNVQRMYFNNGCLSISAQGMEFNDIIGRVWSDRVITRKFKRVPIIKNITHIDGNFYVEPTENSDACEFLQFILNVSNFWGNKPGYVPTEKDMNDYQTHIVNKITAIGFLLTDFKFQTELKAVIAMDSQMGDVGQSNGRTGKSLIGAAIAKIMSQAVVDGQKTKNDDEYIYSEVTPRTRNLFIDDVKTNFDFKNFFAAITNDLAVNPKTKARFVIKNARSPKIYITTNHAINELSTSATERIVYMAFSDWYNDDRRPVDDFGHQFFVDWDEEQWNLFDNFMAECCMYYLTSMSQVWYRTGQGAVPPPMSDIKKRTLKQKMSEPFYQWAEIYFDPSAGHLNKKETRKSMHEAFNSTFSGKDTFVTSANFKTKLVLFCEFKELHFNIEKPNKHGVGFHDFIKNHPNDIFEGIQDKSGGVEYFRVSTKDFSLQQPF